MYIDINGYDTRSAENMDLYLPRCSREIYKRSFLYKGSSLWNQLQPCLKESISTIDFKRITYFCMLETLLVFDAFVWTFYVLYETSSCWQRIMFVVQLVISIFIYLALHSFYLIFYMG